MASRYLGSARVQFDDDDLKFTAKIADYLEEQNIQVRCSGNGENVERHFEADEPDLVLLDVRLSPGDGFELLRGIRSGPDVPVIIITGHLRDEVDRAAGLELGADHYLAKPFVSRDLLARVRAILTRQRSTCGALRGRSPAGYSFDGWELDLKRRRLANARGAPVLLTKGEYALLVAFLAAPERPLTREHLLNATRMHEDVFDRSVDVQVFRLRRKLEVNPDAPRIIQTERGIGYRFTCPVKRL
jgi:two-component system, OmpR family, response regulator